MGISNQTSQLLDIRKKELNVKSKEEVILKQDKLLNEKINKEFDNRFQTENMEAKQPEEIRSWGIVPDFLQEQDILFFSKNNNRIKICGKSRFHQIPSFTKPWIKVKAFDWGSPNRPENIKTMDFEELKRFGFGIAVLGLDSFSSWRKGQKKKYILYMLTKSVIDSRIINYLPKNCYLQKDINNRMVRIVGQNTNPSGRGVWLNIDDGSHGGYVGKVEKEVSGLRRHIPQDNYIPEDKKWKKMEITDIPILITDSNELLCIPNSKETKSIGIVGMMGSCKSMFLNVLLFYEHNLLGKACVNLNDYQKQTFEQSFPSESFKHIRKRINAKPYPIRMVYVYPSSESLHILKQDKKYPHIKMALPLEEVIKNIKYYYELGKSSVYFQNLRKELLDCNSFQEMASVIEESIPEKHKMMKFKLISILRALDQSEIADVSINNAHASLKVKTADGVLQRINYSIISILKAGLVPSLQTSTLWNENHFAAYMSFIINSIYDNQRDDSYFKNKSISIYIDEINRLWEKQNGGALVKQALGNIGTNSRGYRLALRWSSQHISQISPQVLFNTKYLFVSRLTNSSEVRTIARDFDIPKAIQKDILNLEINPNKELFELVGLTTEKFLLIDLETGKRTFTSDPQKGRLIPSPARHYHPK